MTINKIYNIFKTCNGISTDTRTLDEDSLFVALKGDNFNGNKFVEIAFSNGAKYCIVDEASAVINSNCILVEDALETLQGLAKFHRSAIGIPIIGLTGSNGKTTTKELICTVLAKSYNVKATKGNLNNHIGVPLTLLGFSKDLDFGIVEMGANHQKEIEFLSQIAQPDHVVITNFGKAHLEGFGGVQGVIKGKSELYDYAKTHNKTIFIHADDHIQVAQTKNYSNIVTFGHAPENDFQIKFNSASPFVSLSISELKCQSQLIGAYNFNNIAIAVAIGLYFKVPQESIKEAIENYVPTNNRSQILIKDSNKIILDAYNANPTSMTAAIENFAQLEGTNKVLFLGDMFELGTDAAKEHQSIANKAAQHFNEQVYLIGNNFFNTETSQGTRKFKTYQDFERFITTQNFKDASILIKGSRGMALERILNVI